jgi:Flp pilus assembly protein TadD
MSESKGTGRLLLAGALIAAAALLAYAGTFSYPFVFDGAAIVARNPTLRHLGTALAPPHDGSTVDGRPLVNLSLALNYAASGTAVWSYHALNLAVHILAAWTLLGIVRRTVGGSEGRALGIALVIALLWTVHPLQTEAVTYIVQRAESLAALFYLLTLYGFIRASAGGRGAPLHRGWAALSVLACLAGTATKEVIVSAPVIVLLYDRTFVSGSFRLAWRRHRGLLVALAATWIPLGVLVLAAAGRHGTAGFVPDLDWLHYLRLQAYAVPHYLRLALWPAPLVFDYGTGLVPPAGWLPGAGLLALLALATIAGLAARDGRARTLGFLGAAFFALLAPTSLVPVATQTIAEHRMYLPLAAVVAVIVLALGRTQVRTGLLVALGSAAAVGLAAATRHRNAAYASEDALWADTVAKVPGNDRAHNNLGNAFYLEGRIPEAVAQYREALRLRPGNNPEAEYNLGNGLLQEGQLTEAIAHTGEAVRLVPGNPAARNVLGTALARAGRLAEAREQFQAAVQLDPASPATHSNLGTTWLLLGRKAEAEEEYRAALRLDPGYGDAREALAHLEAPAGP